MGKKIAIIGGGVSGLACAQRLAAESESSIDSIVVFDTGNRQCGGRISSRMDKKTGFAFDHAAQYFSVKDNKTEFANTKLVTTTNETKKTTSVAFFKRRALHAVVWSFLCDGNVMRVTFSYACRRYLYELCISAKAVNIRRSAISHSSS